jgi:hypothetical protein
MAKRPEERWETSRRFVAALKAGLDGEIEQTAVHDTATTRMMEDNAPRAAVAAAGAAGGARGAVATPPPQPATPPPSPVERIAAGRAPGGAGAPPRERTPRDSGPAGPPPDRSSRRALAALAALLVVLGVGIALAATNGGDDEPTTKANRDKPAKARDKKPDNTPTAAPAAAEEETAAPATEEAETPAPTATPAEEEEAPVSGDPAALNDEGFQLLQSGDAAGAVTPLQGAVDSCGDSDALDPCGYAYYNLGLALTQAGRASEAIPVLQARLDRWGYDRPQEVKKALKDACKAAGQKC